MEEILNQLFNQLNKGLREGTMISSEGICCVIETHNRFK